MRHGKELIVITACLAGSGCMQELTASTSGNIEVESSNLVIAPSGVWSSRTSDVCFQKGGGPVALDGTDKKCIRKPSSANTAQLYACNGSSSQTFTIEIDHTFRLGGKCMQPVAGATADKTKVEFADCNGSSAQQWGRTISDRSPSAFVNYASQRCLNVPSRNDLTQIDMRDCKAADAEPYQEFTVPAAGTSGPITSSDGKCVHVVGAAAVAGTAVELVACDGSAAQTWNANAARTTFQSLGKCLQADANNAVIIGDCNGGAAQAWTVNASGSLTAASALCLNKPTARADQLQQLVVKRCDGTPVPEQAWTIPETPVSPSHRRLIRDSIMNTWGAVTLLELRNWDTCPPDVSGLVNMTEIQSLLDVVRWAGGKNGHRVLSHALSPATLQLGDQDWNRAGAVHEFGHLLSFGHEQQRRDNQDSHFCDAEGVGADQIDFGLYDPESSMNYCGVAMPVNEFETGYANLARNDIMGVQRVLNPAGAVAYGERTNRQAIWRSGTYMETAIPQSAAGTPLLPGQGWASVDGAVELRFATDGSLGVYRNDLYLRNDSTKGKLPPIWRATDASGTVVTGTSAAFASTGQLVIYNGATPVWTAPDVPVPGALLAIQHDANVVIRGADGLRVWDTNTPHRELLGGAVGLIPGATLAGTKTTKSGRFSLTLTADGNLVIVDRGTSRTGNTVIWSSNTAGRGVTKAMMMLDGTLRLLNAQDQTLWTAPFAGKPAAFVALQEDGNLVAYEPVKFEVWHLGGTNACLETWRSLPAAQTCLKETQSDRAQCKLYLDCYYANGCGPSTCGNPDDVCGVNVIKTGGMAPKTIADQTYLAMGCPATANAAVPKAGAFVPTYDAPAVRLWNGSFKAQGTVAASESGRAVLVLRGDGKLALTINGATRWVSGNSETGVLGGLERSGDLVVRDASGKSIPISSTDHYMNAYLSITDAGVVTIQRVVTNGADNVGFDF